MKKGETKFTPEAILSTQPEPLLPPISSTKEILSSLYCPGVPALYTMEAENGSSVRIMRSVDIPKLISGELERMKEKRKKELISSLEEALEKGPTVPGFKPKNGIPGKGALMMKLRKTR